MTKQYPIDPIDAYVGMRLRQARIEQKLTQAIVGRYIGVTFQQIQKNEKGMNRISAGNLARFAFLLGVPVAYFYEGLPPYLLKAWDIIGAMAPASPAE